MPAQQMKEFQDYVHKNWDSWDRDGYVIAVLGLGGEAGECQEHIKKFIRGDGPVDVEKLKLELGDVLHYLTVLARFHKLSLEDLAAANIKKLNERFGRAA